MDVIRDWELEGEIEAGDDSRDCWQCGNVYLSCVVLSHLVLSPPSYHVLYKPEPAVPADELDNVFPACARHKRNYDGPRRLIHHRCNI
jgi:hypothetical protein